MGLESRIVTVVLKRDGKFMHVLERCSPEDAARWAEDHHVFQLAAVGKSWAVHYVNDRKIMTDQTQASGGINPVDGGGAGAIVRLLQIKGDQDGRK